MNDDGYNDNLNINMSISGISSEIKNLKLLLVFNVSLSVRFFLEQNFLGNMLKYNYFHRQK
jgi:hypothetical protein